MARLAKQAVLPSDRGERAHLARLGRICTSWAVSRDFLGEHFGEEILKSKRFVAELHNLAKVYASDVTLAAVDRASYNRRNSSTSHRGLDREKSFQPADLVSASTELAALESSDEPSVLTVVHPSTNPQDPETIDIHVEEVTPDEPSVLTVVHPSTRLNATESVDSHLGDYESINPHLEDSEAINPQFYDSESIDPHLKDSKTPASEFIDPHLKDSKRPASTRIILAKRKSSEPLQERKSRFKVSYSTTAHII